ncbi:MAG: hypothetical protein M0R00_06420 [Candidatus Omnitrophica bacterium]|jgi:hypothetical protein|nr:hypothetical protein [Candidatus Omnitrophota bacterium]
MKKFGFILLALLVCGAVYALSTNVTQRQVRDPRQLETVLDENFTILARTVPSDVSPTTVATISSTISTTTLWFAYGVLTNAVTVP